jgi:hypothetical protein
MKDLWPHGGSNMLINPKVNKLNEDNILWKDRQLVQVT